MVTMSDLLDATRPASQRPIPRGALIPGLLGLIPFWLLPLSGALPIGLAPDLALAALSMYGSIILSFVGALWWGLAVHAPASAPRTTMFIWSVFPALIGWVAMLASVKIGLLMLITGLTLQWVLDGMLARHAPGLVPNWVLRLRTMLTIGAVSALALAWWKLV